MGKYQNQTKLFQHSMKTAASSLWKNVFQHKSIHHQWQLILLAFKTAVLGTFFFFFSVVQEQHLYLFTSISVFIFALMEIELYSRPKKIQATYLCLSLLLFPLSVYLGCMVSSLPSLALLFTIVGMGFMGFTEDFGNSFQRFYLLFFLIFVLCSGLPSSSQIAQEKMAYYFLGHGSMMLIFFIHSVFQKSSEKLKFDNDIKLKIFTVIFSNYQNISHGLRLSIGGFLSYMCAHFMNLPQAGWVPMTTLLLLKKTTSQTFEIILHRLAGSLLGCLFAALIVIFVTSPWLMCACLFVTLYFSMRTFSTHYGAYVFFVTPTVLILIALQTHANRTLPIVRLENTILGIMVALSVVVVWMPLEKSLSRK